MEKFRRNGKILVTMKFNIYRLGKKLFSTIISYPGHEPSDEAK